MGQKCSTTCCGCRAFIFQARCSPSTHIAKFYRARRNSWPCDCSSIIDRLTSDAICATLVSRYEDRFAIARSVCNHPGMTGKRLLCIAFTTLQVFVGHGPAFIVKPFNNSIVLRFVLKSYCYGFSRISGFKISKKLAACRRCGRYRHSN